MTKLINIRGEEVRMEELTRGYEIPSTISLELLTLLKRLSKDSGEVRGVALSAMTKMLSLSSQSILNSLDYPLFTVIYTLEKAKIIERIGMIEGKQSYAILFDRVNEIQNYINEKRIKREKQERARREEYEIRTSDTFF
ncbi:hypothetical protein [Bacillus wiedmannii]|uniref:hypothetical protein n=1 Tax=Bacillus wiedmannii TaxID=1890302 RepID=UPI000BF033F6|nr:hypothetical protein [Bacillus wiedmannii]PEL59661.1 hypothetical protein CN622_17745 [Bacillus wiedmannii]